MSSQANIDGGELVIRTLERAGVSDIFTLHGGHLDSIFQACLDHDIRLIDTRHEAAAGHAADAYARQTGGLGVAIATAGPGFTNIITAITQAYLDCVPVLFVAGAAPLRDEEVLPLQGGIDQVAMARPVTKWAQRVTRTERIPHMTAQAIREARNGRPGPVFLELPIDVLFNRVDAAEVSMPETIEVDIGSRPSVATVASILDLISSAQRPVIVAGGGVLFSRAAQALTQFAEATGIPVFANSKALGAVPTDHPLSGYSLSNLGVVRGSGAGEPDVALFLGARFGMFTRGDQILPASCKVVQVDISGTELGRNRHVDIPVVADCRETLRALNEVVGERSWPDWSQWANAVHATTRWHEVAYRFPARGDVFGSANVNRAVSITGEVRCTYDTGGYTRREHFPVPDPMVPIQYGACIFAIQNLGNTLANNLIGLPVAACSQCIVMFPVALVLVWLPRSATHPFD